MAVLLLFRDGKAALLRGRPSRILASMRALERRHGRALAVRFQYDKKMEKEQ